MNKYVKEDANGNSIPTIPSGLRLNASDLRTAIEDVVIHQWSNTSASRVTSELLESYVRALVTIKIADIGAINANAIDGLVDEIIAKAETDKSDIADSIKQITRI